MKDQKQKWYDRSEFKTRQGELILPSDFSAFKYRLKSEWVTGLKPSLYFKDDNLVNNAEGEIIYSFFAKQFGIKVVEARPAILLKSDSIAIKGVVTENFIENTRTQKYVTADELKHEVITSKVGKRFYKDYEYSGNNTVYQCMENLKHIHLCISNKKKGKEVVLDPNLKEDMIKMILLDYIFLNEDRHANNFVFVIEEKSDCYFVSLGKIFDNSYILTLPKVYRKPKELEKAKVLKHTNKMAKLRMSIKTGFSYGLPVDEAAQELAEYITSNANMFDLYKKIKSFNFDNLESLIQKTIPEYKISPKILKLLNIVVPHTKKILTKKVNKIIYEKNNNKVIQEKSDNKILNEKSTELQF